MQFYFPANHVEEVFNNVGPEAKDQVKVKIRISPITVSSAYKVTEKVIMGL